MESGATILDIYIVEDRSYEESLKLADQFKAIDVAGDYLFALSDTTATAYELVGGI